MMDHNVLRDEIFSANRYRKLQDLKLSISGLKMKVPLSISAELEGRILEKIRTFDYPMCTSARIKVIFSNGLSRELEPDECHYAMSRGMKLSDYIFSHYVSARDFEIESPEILGTKNFGVFSDQAEPEVNDSIDFTSMAPAALRERVDFLLKKVENLEKIESIYAESLPKMARDMNELKEKVDKIYKRVVRE